MPRPRGDDDGDAERDTWTRFGPWSVRLSAISFAEPRQTAEPPTLAEVLTGEFGYNIAEFADGYAIGPHGRIAVDGLRRVCRRWDGLVAAIPQARLLSAALVSLGEYSRRITLRMGRSMC